MKKIVLPLLLLGLTTAGLQAQEMQQTTSTETSTNTNPNNEFNKWSIDVNGGLNRATRPFAEGYSFPKFSLFHADLGFRYMFNTKFGLKLAGGYDRFTEGDNSLPYEANIVNVNLQGYANLGRIMDFQTWTQRINLLGHLGVGVSQFTGDRFEGEDYLGNFLIGMTAQYKISDRVGLNLDFTMVNNFRHNKTWDGSQFERDANSDGFNSTLYNATIGLSIYLGKNEEHADWFVPEKSDELLEMENRLGELETMMNDSDKDGVPDYLDAEPNTIAGVNVDSKGRTIDKNGNGIPDELESVLENNRGTDGTSGTSGGGSTDLADLINGGYVNVYFDFNQDQPNAQSVSGINFLIKYLKENPTVSSDVIGYADEIGNTEYNKALSTRRAQNVKQILVDSGIDAGRLNIVGNGEDTSVNKGSSYARKVVRRVTFMLK